ncbi:MAG: choice-of-anchor D domain-containing protein [Rhodothermia bacterium]
MTQQLPPVILLVLLLLAGSVQAQGPASNSAGDVTVQGEPPIPRIVSISSVPETITLGETFDVDVRAENTGGLADLGTVAISFPNFTGPDDGSFVSEQPGTSDDSPGYGETPKGLTIKRGNGSTMTAKYLLVEFADDQWEGSETNTLVLRVQPKDVGTFVIQIRVTMLKVSDSFNDPSAGQIDQQGWEVITRTITVVAVPEILVSPSSHDYGTVTVDSSASRLFSVENTGGGTLTGAASISAGGGQYTITSGGGNFNLTSGEIRTVTVRFTPTASGAQPGTFRVTHNASNLGSPIDADLTGSGIVQPQISVSPGSHDFGTIVVGEDSSQTFTIANTNGSTLEGAISVSSGETHYSIVSGGGNYSLPVGESIDVEVRFAPQSAGRQTGTLQVTHNGSNPASPINAPLAGTGLRLPEITLSPASYDYGIVTVGNDSGHVFTITNSGGGALKGVVSILSEGGLFSIDSGSGSYSLTAGQTKSVTVLYVPGAAGNHSGTLRVTHTGSNAAAPLDAPLTGSAIAAPIDAAMMISPETDTLDFDELDPGVMRTTFLIGSLGPDSLRGFVTLANLTGKLSAISETSVDSSFTIDQGAGAFAVAPSRVYVVVVAFEPVAEGLNEATLKIDHNASNLPNPLVIALRGTGAAPVSVETTREAGAFELLPSYPNPASSQTQVTFVLGEPGYAKLILYDMLGREVKRIIDERINPGQTTIAIPTADLSGGRYVLRLQVEGKSASQIMVIP